MMKSLVLWKRCGRGLVPRGLYKVISYRFIPKSCVVFLSPLGNVGAVYGGPAEWLPPARSSRWIKYLRLKLRGKPAWETSDWSRLGLPLTTYRQNPNLAPAPIRVAIPNAAKIAAAIECTSFIGILLASLSPAKTTGTSAISMPRVVPITTIRGAE